MKQNPLSVPLRLLLLRGRPSGGFTMLEVLVALMISFAFLMGTMNAMVIAAVMQVKAERQAQALYWIQRDLETIRARASDSLGTPTMCTASTFATGYGGALKTVVDAISTPSPPPDILNRPNKVYTMTRNTSGNNTNPSILTVTYTVSHPNDLESIATLYTEVLPDAALSC